MDFEFAIGRTLGEEGGYSFDKKDPGGETNWGITWPILRLAIADGVVPKSTTIKSLTRVQAIVIYEKYFWKAINADALFDGVAYQALDFAVNSGPDTAIRALQRALDVADDGRFGPISRKAAATMGESDQIMRLNAERLDFMRRLSNWPAAGRGWAGRIASNLRHGAIDS